MVIQSLQEAVDYVRVRLSSVLVYAVENTVGVALRWCVGGVDGYASTMRWNGGNTRGEEEVDVLN